VVSVLDVVTLVVVSVLLLMLLGAAVLVLP